jgi:hypothetical protein
MKNSNFNILITTYNRPKSIHTLLKIFSNNKWKGLLIKPNIIISDDSDNYDTEKLVKIYTSKINQFKIFYFKNNKRLGHIHNFWHILKTFEFKGYIWNYGDDDIPIINPSILFINKIIKIKPDLALCEFRQGDALSKGTFFKGKNRVINSPDESIKYIKCFGKSISLCFKILNIKQLILVEKYFKGCCHDDRMIAIFSFLKSKNKKIYLQSDLTAYGDKKLNKLNYTTRAFGNMENCINRMLNLFFKNLLNKKKFFFLEKNSKSEIYWYMYGLLSTLRLTTCPPYTLHFLLRELLIFPLVLLRFFLGIKIVRVKFF